MKKILPMIMIVLLIISGIGAVSINADNIETGDKNVESKTLTLNVFFTNPKLNQYNKEYIELNLEEISTYLSDPGKPFLPKIVKSFELPFGVKNVNVEVTPKNIREENIIQKIRPTSPHIPLIQLNQENYIDSDNEGAKQSKLIDETIYSSMNPYPEKWFKYRV